jgi:predicted membrane channel-forming protein YqfA (hemolysin III family)
MTYELQLQVTEVFLIAMSIFTVALAEARNEKLKTGLSIAGLVLAFGLFVSLLDASAPGQAHAAQVLRFVPYLALMGWSVSLFVHGRNWYRGVAPEVQRRVETVN